MNKRDLGLLSAYLDGELKPSDSAKLEARLITDPDLVSVLNNLRAARTLLRKLPQRKAPRNFTLTRKMVGQNPPLPRAYPVFRFATSLATLLLFITFAANFFAPQMMQPANLGRGGGAPQEAQSFAAEAPAATEAPVEAPAPAGVMPAPTATSAGEPSVLTAPQPTSVMPTEEALRIIETPVAKDSGGQPPQTQNDAMESSATQNPKLISSAWQIGLAVAVVFGIVFMVLMRGISARRWK